MLINKQTKLKSTFVIEKEFFSTNFIKKFSTDSKFQKVDLVGLEKVLNLLRKQTKYNKKQNIVKIKSKLNPKILGSTTNIMHHTGIFLKKTVKAGSFKRLMNHSFKLVNLLLDFFFSIKRTTGKSKYPFYIKRKKLNILIERLVDRVITTDSGILTELAKTLTTSNSSFKTKEEKESFIKTFSSRYVNENRPKPVLRNLKGTKYTIGDWNKKAKELFYQTSPSIMLMDASDKLKKWNALAKNQKGVHFEQARREMGIPASNPKSKIFDRDTVARSMVRQKNREDRKNKSIQAVKERIDLLIK